MTAVSLSPALPPLSQVLGDPQTDVHVVWRGGQGLQGRVVAVHGDIAEENFDDATVRAELCDHADRSTSIRAATRKYHSQYLVLRFWDKHTIARAATMSFHGLSVTTYQDFGLQAKDGQYCVAVLIDSITVTPQYYYY